MGALFLVVTDIVSWVPPTKRCRVAFRGLSVQMLPVAGDQRPALRNGRSGFSSRRAASAGPGAGDQPLGGSTPLLASLTHVSSLPVGRRLNTLLP